MDIANLPLPLCKIKLKLLVFFFYLCLHFFINIKKKTSNILYHEIYNDTQAVFVGLVISLSQANKTGMVVAFKLLGAAGLKDECDRNGVTDSSPQKIDYKKKHKTYGKSKKPMNNGLFFASVELECRENGLLVHRILPLILNPLY